jgi:hypothetical protein
MNILVVIGAAGALALFLIGGSLVAAWLRERTASKRFAMDPVRRLRR